MSSPEGTVAGLVGGYQGDSTAVQIVIGVFIALALYNGVELALLTLLTFKRHSGLYFWAMLLTNVLGVMPSALSNLLHFYAICPMWLPLTLGTIAFYFMVPGQSIVLYSRLHLVLYNQNTLRRVLYLIIICAIILLIPTTITTYASVYVQTGEWHRAYSVMERLQVTWFCAQETLISGLYIWETSKLLSIMPENSPRQTRILHELLAINLAMILMDVGLLVTEFLGLYYIQVPLKAAVYSIKLKLEFAVLNRLVLISNMHCCELSVGAPGCPNSQNQAYTPSGSM